MSKDAENVLLWSYWTWCFCAEALTSPVYRYVVTHTPSGPLNTSVGLLPYPSRFAFHCLDTVAFFGALESVLGKPLSDGDKKFQDLITRHLVTFAKTGEHAFRTLLERIRSWSAECRIGYQCRRVPFRPALDDLYGEHLAFYCEGPEMGEDETTEYLFYWFLKTSHSVSPTKFRRSPSWDSAAPRLVLNRKNKIPWFIINFFFQRNGCRGIPGEIDWLISSPPVTQVRWMTTGLNTQQPLLCCRTAWRRTRPTRRIGANCGRTAACSPTPG